MTWVTYLKLACFGMELQMVFVFRFLVPLTVLFLSFFSSPVAADHFAESQAITFFQTDDAAGKYSYKTFRYELPTDSLIEPLYLSVHQMVFFFFSFFFLSFFLLSHFLSISFLLQVALDGTFPMRGGKTGESVIGKIMVPEGFSFFSRFFLHPSFLLFHLLCAFRSGYHVNSFCVFAPFSHNLRQTVLNYGDMRREIIGKGIVEVLAPRKKTALSIARCYSAFVIQQIGGKVICCLHLSTPMIIVDCFCFFSFSFSSLSFFLF